MFLRPNIVTYKGNFTIENFRPLLFPLELFILTLLHPGSIRCSRPGNSQNLNLYSVINEKKYGFFIPKKYLTTESLFSLFQQ